MSNPFTAQVCDKQLVQIREPLAREEIQALEEKIIGSLSRIDDTDLCDKLTLAVKMLFQLLQGTDKGQATYHVMVDALQGVTSLKQITPIIDPLVPSDIKSSLWYQTFLKFIK